MSSHRPWCPPEVHANTGRLRSAGSRCLPVPRRHRYYAALRLLFPFGRRSGRPSLTAYHLATLLLHHTAAAPLPATCRRLITGPPSHRKQRWRYEASQVSGPSSSVRAAILNPAPRAAVSPTPDVDAAAFKIPGPLGSGNIAYFVANSRGPHARVPTHRRLPHGSGARLATGLPGSALTGRDSHPLDDKQDFRTPLVPSLLTSLTWSHHGTAPSRRPFISALT